MPDFEGCLSIKTVLSGSAVWQAGGRTFPIVEDQYLILNDSRRYSITIDSVQRVRTFCLFFERGFVEDVKASGLVAEAIARNGVQGVSVAPAAR